MTGSVRRSVLRLVALVATLAMVAAACDGGGDGGGEGTGGDGDGRAEGRPVRGGRVVYALEAETSGGFCLPEAQLAISGIQVARTIYDTLTAPNARGEIEPFLAASVTPNDDFTEFTVTLREGIKFHDGSDLTAEVVKNNIDAYRGEYKNAAGEPIRRPLLFIFVFQNIASVEVVDPLTVKVTAKTPWPALPWYLWGSGRIGIMAQAQLDDQESCDRTLIGTGPFELASWRVNDRLVARAFDGYWQDGEDGQPLPYLDEIEYRPMPDSVQRVNALDAGEIMALHVDTGAQVADLRALDEQGDVTLLESDKFTEVDYVMFNETKAPFDSLTARQAVTAATDRAKLLQVVARGVGTAASGPFAEGSVGFLPDTGFPEFDLDEAKRLVAKYESEVGPLRFSYSTTPTPVNTQTAQLLKEMWEAAGAEVSIKQVEQAQLINDAIAKNFEAIGWRNHPGADPDLQYVWWQSESPVNFGGFKDLEIDELLQTGRESGDPDERKQIYEDLNRRFAQQLHNLWLRWTTWVIATAPNVKGVLGPDLPEGGEPFPGIPTGHPVAGLWVET